MNEINIDNDIKTEYKTINVAKFSRNLNNLDKNMQSENRLINIKNEIESKGSISTDLSSAKEIELESNINNIESKNKKGIFRKGIDWINDIFKEISLLWKKEELVDAYDANGNLVKRPKNKIPYIKKQKENNNEEEKIKDFAKTNTLNFAQAGINYGMYFN